MYCNSLIKKTCKTSQKHSLTHFTQFFFEIFLTFDKESCKASRRNRLVKQKLSSAPNKQPTNPKRFYFRKRRFYFVDTHTTFVSIMRTCSICNKMGHNKKTCPMRPTTTCSPCSTTTTTSKAPTIRKCSICGEAGHTKTTCAMNPNSKKGKQLALRKRQRAINNGPKLLGEVYEVNHKERLLGYSAYKPPTSAEISLYARSFPENGHKRFFITGKVSQADIF